MPLQVSNPVIQNYLTPAAPQKSEGADNRFRTQQEESVKELTQERRDNVQETAVEEAARASSEAQIEAYAAGLQKQSDFYASYEATTTYIENYNQFSAEMRRSEAINTYVDNGGEFNRVGERASTLPINQVEAGERESVRATGIANEGALVSEPQYTLSATTQAIENYNQVAQSAKNAQNHMTYLQISMTGLSPLNYLGSA